MSKLNQSQLQQHSATHLRYEGVLFFLLAERLLDWALKIVLEERSRPDMNDPEDWSTVMGVLEAFALKTRLLRDFFFDPFKPHQADVMAKEFDPTWVSRRGQQPQKLKSASVAANQQAAHLSERLTLKSWEVAEVAEELALLFDRFFSGSAAVDLTATDEIRAAIERFRKARTRLDQALAAADLNMLQERAASLGVGVTATGLALQTAEFPAPLSV